MDLFLLMLLNIKKVAKITINKICSILLIIALQLDEPKGSKLKDVFEINQKLKLETYLAKCRKSMIPLTTFCKDSSSFSSSSLHIATILLVIISRFDFPAG